MARLIFALVWALPMLVFAQVVSSGGAAATVSATADVLEADPSVEVSDTPVTYRFVEPEHAGVLMLRPKNGDFVVIKYDDITAIECSSVAPRTISFCEVSVRGWASPIAFWDDGLFSIKGVAPLLGRRFDGTAKVVLRPKVPPPQAQTP